MFPDWSPDQKKISFVSDRGGSLQLWVMDVEGGESDAIRLSPQPLMLPGADHPSFASITGAPRWSPKDGEAIAYLASHDARFMTGVALPMDGGISAGY